jgi:hypothetical protein
MLGMLDDGSYVTLIPSIDRGMGFSVEGSYVENSEAEDAVIVLHGHRSSRDNKHADSSVPYKAVSEYCYCFCHG